MKPEEEEKKIRHTISAEETFTLAKDVFDMRTLIKNVYANRAVIARRVNVVTLCVSTVFTLLYVTFVFISAFYDKIALKSEILVYSIAGAYFAVAIFLTIFALLSSRQTTKSLKRFSVTLKIIRIIARLLSLSMSVLAIYYSVSGGVAALPAAVDIVVVILSIFTIIVQLVPMLFGGLGKYVRWLLSPVKLKQRFSGVLLEWYQLAITGTPLKGAKNRIDKKHYDAIGRIIDGTLVPALGKKYITSIKSPALLNLVENSPAEDRPVLEGVLKSVFSYAAECGYITFDPCRDLNFSGSVEEPHKKTMKEKLVEGIGKRLGKSMLDKYIAASSDEDKQ